MLANGRHITRSVGFAIVFAEPGDLLLLEAHTLEGLNLTIDAVKLVARGPSPQHR